MKMEPIGCVETPARNYHYSLRNNPEERSYHRLRRGSLNSCIRLRFYVTRRTVERERKRLCSGRGPSGHLLIKGILAS